MANISVNTGELSNVNNLLTDFLDFLWKSNSGSGIILFNQFPSYDLDGKLVEASQFGRPDNEDIADCLEALGMLPDRGKAYHKDNFMYMHGVGENDTIMPVVFNIRISIHQGNYGLQAKLESF